MWKGHPWYLYEKGYPDIWMEKGKPDICMEPVAGGSTYFWDFTRLSVISTPGEHQSSSPSTRAVFWEQTLWNKQCKHHHQLWVVDLHRLGKIFVIKVKSSQKRGCSSLTPPCYKACYEGSTKGQAGSRTRDLMDRSRKTWPRYFEPKSSIKVDMCEHLEAKEAETGNDIWRARIAGLVLWYSCTLVHGGAGWRGQ